MGTTKIISAIIIIILLPLATVFVWPSLIINRGNLVKALDSYGNTAGITFKDIDLKASSPSMFGKELKLSATELCVNKEGIQLCLPQVSADIVFDLGFENIRIGKIKELTVSKGNLTLVQEKSPSPKTDGGGPNNKMSLIFRVLELFSDLTLKDIETINIDNFTFSVNIKGAPANGALSIKKEPERILLNLDGSYKGKDLGLLARFGDRTSLNISSNSKNLAILNVEANPFTEFFEYIKSKETYRYQTKDLRANVSLKDINELLKLSAVNFELPDLLDIDIALLLNKPNYGDALLELDINDQARIVYDFYQKIPTAVDVSRLQTSDPVYYMLLSLFKKLDYSPVFYRENGELKVSIKRDYSRLPRKTY